MVGGWRSGRERKLRTCPDPIDVDREPCTGEVVVAGADFAARLGGAQRRVLVSAIHAAPAPAALRNFRRESFVLESLFLPVATSSGR
jgi:hypothetical protein